MLCNPDADNAGLAWVEAGLPWERHGPSCFLTAGSWDWGPAV